MARDDLDRAIELMQQRRQEAIDAYQQQAQQQAYREATGWMQPGIKGASMGAAFGPKGAAIGGLIGSSLGMLRAVAARRKKGQSWDEAIGRTLVDVEQLGRPETFTAAMEAAPLMAQGAKGWGGMGQAAPAAAAPAQIGAPQAPTAPAPPAAAPPPQTVIGQQSPWEAYPTARPMLAHPGVGGESLEELLYGRGVY